MRPAGGDTQLNLHLVHQPAHDAIDRLFSHPLENQREMEQHERQIQEHLRLSRLMHG